MLFPYFVYIVHFTKFTGANSLFMKKSLLKEKSQAEESPWEKKKKKPKEERKDTTLSSNEKKFLCESNLYQRSFTLASRFLTKKLLSNHNLPYMMLKTRFPFLHASTILDIKTSTITSNCNFESCMSICCLAPQLILQFFHFWHRFFLYLWQLCSLLCLPLQRSTEQSR